MDSLINNIEKGSRISKEDALFLYQNSDFLMLADLANKKRNMLHPEPEVTYVIDRNINYTNICASKCLFCAFYCNPEDDNGYIISKESLKKKIEETLDLGGTQILLQGGMHPDLDLDFYKDMIGYISDNFPIHIHGFSPPEINYIAEKTNCSVREVIEELMGAGLGSIPGGGAEILVDEIRQKISPNKCTSDDWLNVMETAHELGLRTTATMMFGHVEEPHHIIEHMDRLRSLQDKTGGFTAFIPWTFQPNNTKINIKKADAIHYLRVLALSRLFLDNIDNIQASWVTQGDKVAQLALAFGANDMGSTMIEENVVAAAGVDYMLPREEIVRLIENAGYASRQRDCFYNRIG